MPPLQDFSDCSGTHMDGAPPLADFFLSSLAQLLKDFFENRTYGYKVT